MAPAAYMLQLLLVHPYAADRAVLLELAPSMCPNLKALLYVLTRSTRANFQLPCSAVFCLLLCAQS